LKRRVRLARSRESRTKENLRELEDEVTRDDSTRRRRENDDDEKKKSEKFDDVDSCERDTRKS